MSPRLLSVRVEENVVCLWRRLRIERLATRLESAMNQQQSIQQQQTNLHLLFTP